MGLLQSSSKQPDYMVVHLHRRLPPLQHPQPRKLHTVNNIWSPQACAQCHLQRRHLPFNTSTMSPNPLDGCCNNFCPDISAPGLGVPHRHQTDSRKHSSLAPGCLQGLSLHSGSEYSRCSSSSSTIMSDATGQAGHLPPSLLKHGASVSTPVEVRDYHEHFRR